MADEKKGKQGKQDRTLGNIGLALGILSIAISPLLTTLGLLSGIAGFICAFIHHRRSPGGLAIAGLVTSIFGFLLSFIFMVIWMLIYGAILTIIPIILSFF